MRLLIGTAAAALMLGLAAPAAEAKVYNVAGTINGGSPTATGNPFGYDGTSPLSFSFDMDVNLTTGNAVFSNLSYVTGFHTWVDAEIDQTDSFPVIPSGVPTDPPSGFDLELDPGGLPFTNYIILPSPGPGFASIYDGSEAYGCNRCVTATITPAAVPEPASWALMLLGVGLLGATMRQRRYALSA